MTNANYDSIGIDYANVRKPDPRLAQIIHQPICDIETVLNVGAGTGSYEPMDKDLVALEPSWKMISQRRADAAPCVCGVVEDLPFADNSFAAGLAILTLHHWRDISRGLNELSRVVAKRLVIFTWDPKAASSLWINDYVPENIELDLVRFPVFEDFVGQFSNVSVIEVPVPHDCSDGFLGAYWRRPAAYLYERVRKGSSTFHQISQETLVQGLTQLRADLDSGDWHRRYAELLDKPCLELGYRLVVVDL